jgi:acyl dehydratase
MPAPERWFEDFHPGEVVRAGEVVVTGEEIIGFGRRFDPQPFHTDPKAAAAGPYGGLIASGWHTAALLTRLLVEHVIPPNSGMGSPGVDELRWPQPVRPGDRLSVRVTVLETVPSRSKPDRGMVRSLIEGLNQHGEVVMSMRAMGLYRRRPSPTS